jgi:hypothetical protein
LVVRGKSECKVTLSVDRGRTWVEGGSLPGNLDLTDTVKGYRQYLLRFHTSAKRLVGGEITVTTVCEANASVMPRLKDGGSVVTFAATGQALVSAGPNVPQAAAHIVEGRFDSSAVTLELRTPRGEPVSEVYAAAHVRSSSPPDPKVKYQIEYSTDAGKTWLPIVKDWNINRQGDEPVDFWSQSFCWGNVKFTNEGRGASVRVRFRNNGGKAYARAEMHLMYPVPTDPVAVTFAWTDDRGDHTASHTYTGKTGEQTWNLPTGKNTRTKWVEMTPVK